MEQPEPSNFIEEFLTRILQKGNTSTRSRPGPAGANGTFT
jgi:hypothetical protein